MNRIILIATTASLALILLLTACKKEEEEKGTKIKKEKLSGFVQKGPFINGTQILMTELNSTLEQTGNVFTTQISNSKGSFEISDIQLSSSFVEFTASGFYFDEIKNDISSAQLTLYAISDITDLNTININILTHLEKRRVEFLVKENNYSFENAKQTAQAEVLAAFGMSNEEMQNSEELDISINHADNAILLAISLILQGNRSVGDLTELLALISSDFRENGVIDNFEILNNLRASSLNLNLTAIRQNLVERYQALNVPAAIPEFENYIAMFLDFTPQIPSALIQEATNIKALSATLNGVVNPNSSSTVVSFEYGLTPEFGNTVIAVQSPITGIYPQSVSTELTDLQYNTNYYFRVVAENEKGITASNSISFTTQNGSIALTTSVIVDVTASSANSGGVITNDGGASVIARGVVWSINPEPTLADNFTEDGNGIGTYISVITGLKDNIHYYVRTYATNATGTYYGNEHRFFTFDCGNLLTDYENNIYSTVSLGNQCWMKENLKTTHYRNGVSIENPTGISEWQNNTTGAYVWYNNEIGWKDSYGALYNWHTAINTNGLCPTGWHVPSDAEWTQLVDYVVAHGYPNEIYEPNGAGNALKSCQQVNSPLGGDCNTTEHPRWESNNTHHGFDEFGFSGLPGGFRSSAGLFHNLGAAGIWLHSTENPSTGAWYRSMNNGMGNVSRAEASMIFGCSVRCLRD